MAPVSKSAKVEVWLIVIGISHPRSVSSPGAWESSPGRVAYLMSSRHSLALGQQPGGESADPFLLLFSFPGLLLS